MMFDKPSLLFYIPVVLVQTKESITEHPYNLGLFQS